MVIQLFLNIFVRFDGTCLPTVGLLFDGMDDFELPTLGLTHYLGLLKNEAYSQDEQLLPRK